MEGEAAFVGVHMVSGHESMNCLMGFCVRAQDVSCRCHALHYLQRTWLEHLNHYLHPLLKGSAQKWGVRTVDDS